MTISSLHPPVEIVKKLMTILQAGLVLDIGAGKGRHAMYLAQNGFDVTALEQAGEHVKTLSLKAKERKLTVEIIQQDLLIYKPEKLFDAVVAISVLHFLKDKKEVDRGISKIQAWTKPSGLNVINVMMNIKVNNPRSYLFNKNELKNYYQDWDILFYEEVLGDFYKQAKDTKPIRSWVARLIACKPE